MTTNYYYLITSLPELSLEDKKLLYSSAVLKELLVEFLNKDDFETAQVLYYPYDIANLVNLIKETGAPHEPLGNFSAEDLMTRLTVPEMLPVFMEEFIYDTGNSWAAASIHDLENRLTAAFIEWTRNLSNRFLHQWFEFNHNMKNVAAGLNCRKFQRDIQSEVLGSHFEAEKIRRNKDRDFGLSKVIDRLDRIMTCFQLEDLALRESMLDQFRWDYIGELEEEYQFGVENLMAYIIKSRLIERDVLSSRRAGPERIEYLLDKMKEGHARLGQLA